MKTQYEYIALGESFERGPMRGCTVAEALHYALYAIHSELADQIMDDGWHDDVSVLLEALTGTDIQVYRCDKDDDIDHTELLVGDDSVNWCRDELESRVTAQTDMGEIISILDELSLKLRKIDGLRLDYAATIEHALYLKQNLCITRGYSVKPQNGGTAPAEKSQTLAQLLDALGERHDAIVCKLHNLIECLSTDPRAADHLDMALEILNMMGASVGRYVQMSESETIDDIREAAVRDLRAHCTDRDIVRMVRLYDNEAHIDGKALHITAAINWMKRRRDCLRSAEAKK